MKEAAKAQEPSMEEILASIRRIIAEDDPSKPGPTGTEPPSVPPSELGAQVNSADASPRDFKVSVTIAPALDREPASPDREPAADASQPEAADHADVLELTSAMEARPPAEPRNEEPVIPRMAPREEPPVFRVIDAQPDLVFQEAPPPIGMENEGSNSSESSLRDFGAGNPPEPGPSRPLLSDQATAAVTSAFGSLAHTVLAQNARTLEDLVGEMLRPMLKSWLDDNLPTIVERLVRAEIERVSRGRT